MLGIAAIVASLIFVGLQLRQEQNIALATLGQAEISSRTELNLGMSEFAEVWDKSNRGEPLSTSELLIMESLVDSWFRRAVIGGSTRRSLVGGTSRAAERIFAVMLFRNPGARQIWEVQRENERLHLRQLGQETSFIGEWVDEIQADLTKLDRLNE